MMIMAVKIPMSLICELHCADGILVVNRDGPTYVRPKTGDTPLK